MHQIKDGTGKGFLVKVNSDNRLEVESSSNSIQSVLSIEKRQAYQVIGVATLAIGTTTALHVQNTSSDKNMVVTYIRHQIVDQAGGTPIPNANNYFKLAFGRTYVSGGAPATPINVNNGSGNEADIDSFQGDPVLTGTEEEIDRWYTKAEADMNSLNKEGAVVIPPNRTMELSYVGDQTSGIIYTRLSFLMREIQNVG